MPSKIRLQRISDRLRQELSEMLIKEVQDPRLSGVSVTDVKVDRELAFADIFVSAVEGESRSKEVLAGLKAAAGYLRHELAGRVDLRAFPILRFHWDPTPERADHIERILASLHDEDASRGSNTDSSSNLENDSTEDGDGGEDTPDTEDGDGITKEGDGITEDGDDE